MKTKDLKPKLGSGILVRAISLYVGQGDSTLFFIKDGDRYATMLTDINLDEKKLTFLLKFREELKL